MLTLPSKHYGSSQQMVETTVTKEMGQRWSARIRISASEQVQRGFCEDEVLRVPPIFDSAVAKRLVDTDKSSALPFRAAHVFCRW